MARKANVVLSEDDDDAPIDSDPVCLLCGFDIKIMQSIAVTNTTFPGVAFEEKQWKIYIRTRRKYVLVPSREVENTYFYKYPRLWTAACRAIIKGPNTKHYLTGINILRFDGGCCRYVPRDPHLACIGTKSEDPEFDNSFVHYYTAEIGRQRKWLIGYQCGYSVHAHCWVLLDRVFDGGTEFVEAHLERFIRAARKYWRDHKSLYGSSNWGRQFCGGPPLTFMKCFYGCDIYQNPAVDPKVRRLIEQARKTKAKPSHLCSQFMRVSLDVATLIAEQLCPVNYTVADIKNIRNMLAAFQWVLPECFWSARCRRDVIFELGDIKEIDPINWGALQLDLMTLLIDGKSGLSNRARIIGVITSIKSIYFSMRK
ncbi:hypothetical protein PHISCL_02941 [Aspergillus sclerotialis]|uniref:Uncharacterized protein n=1 Tax=Aspergillus sclerotialis TaxID=2070753 RepID=A0A3A2ZNI7_9EURO|nr:hypothetical protein PHISCL_02941 [Aspergillus sclerotialis]